QISKAERAAILGVSESELDHKDKAEEAVPEAGAEGAAEATEAPAEAAAEPVAAEAAPAETAAEVEHEEEAPAPAPTLEAAPSVPLNIDPAAAMNAQLARVCAAFVRPDRDIHSEGEALSGALRILSDRLGRDPKLRGQLRRLLSKQGVLSVKASAPESRLGRHKALLRIKQPLRQLQGHRLLAIRQAQKERVVQTHLSLDPKLGVPKVRAALGRFTHPAYEQVLGEVASQAFHQRLIPMLEQDVRMDVKDRADQEAVRFVSQSLRQVLSTPPLVGREVVGVDVSPKGDWTCVRVDALGVVQGPAVRIETAGKDSAALGAEFGTAFPTQYELVVAVGNGKSARAVASALRAALKAAQRRAYVFEVNETGLSSYANSEVARTELAEFKVPERMAISIARRLQDPLLEFLKVESRGLSVGSEAGLLTKAAAKRLFRDTIEASVAHIGADINRATLAFLTSLPGIDRETAQKILVRRAQTPFTSRKELRQEGLLSEAQWTSVIAFLRVRGGSEPL
ncbi:MAG: helix-hairpin-helix domain-containing protein, partial [Planctomycetia bacterium]